VEAGEVDRNGSTYVGFYGNTIYTVKRDQGVLANLPLSGRYFYEIRVSADFKTVFAIMRGESVQQPDGNSVDGLSYLVSFDLQSLSLRSNIVNGVYGLIRYLEISSDGKFVATRNYERSGPGDDHRNPKLQVRETLTGRVVYESAEPGEINLFLP
jgi:hypothetical protein